MTTPTTGRDFMADFIPASPLVKLLGIEIADLGTDQASLRLPFRDEVTTIGQVVHGGAIAALADTAVMAACWCGAEVPETIRGATVDLTMHYLAPAVATDLTADARVLRRGRKISHAEVGVRDASGTPVAHGVGTYQIG